jgi:hypothetical protein
MNSRFHCSHFLSLCDSMSSVIPATVTAPAPRPSLAVNSTKGTATVTVIGSSVRKRDIFKQMILLTVTVVLTVALVLLCVAFPPYYDLKLRRENLLLGNCTSAQKEKTGLEYFSHWRMKLWGNTTPSVSISSIGFIFSAVFIYIILRV